MRHTQRWALGLLAACAMSAATAASVGAYELTFRTPGVTQLSGTLRFTQGAFDVECPLTFGGSLASGWIAMSLGNQVGSIATAQTRSELCAGGGAFNGWLGAAPLLHSGTTGTLPTEATELRWAMSLSGIELIRGEDWCLYRGSVLLELSLRRTRAPGVYTTGAATVDPETTALSLFTASGEACPSTIGVSGTLSFGATQTITIA